MILYIFDVDGTLVKIKDSDIYGIFNSIKKETLSDKELSLEACLDFWFGSDEETLPALLGLNKEEFWKLFKKYDNVDFRRACSKFYEDVYILGVLKSRGALVAINSDAPDSIVDAQVGSLKGTVNLIVTNHKGIKRKPEPDGIKKILEELCVAPLDACYVGNTLNDIIAARRAEVLSILVEREGNQIVNKVNPDYRIFSLEDILKVMTLPEQILFREVNVVNNPYFNRLDENEKRRLQNHFRRMQQHCLVVGQFMEYQARELGYDTNLWKTTGILHDIDYARVFFNMVRHGFESRRILEPYRIVNRIIESVEKHNIAEYQFSNDPYQKSIFFSGRFIKQMVHAMRKFGYKSIAEVTLDDFDNVYNSEARRNERLTHLDPSPEPFEEFKIQMKIRTYSIEGYPIPKELLFFLAKRAFADTHSTPSNIPNQEEIEVIYQNGKK